jgi:gluconokinase
MAAYSRRRDGDASAGGIGPRPAARHARPHVVIVVMGVSGAGKTTVGSRLAAALGWPFHEGDALHAPAAVAKMRRGVPLEDADRDPWLARLRALLDGLLAAGHDAVVTCSALTRAHRERLGLDRPGIVLVHLHGTETLLRARLRRRTGHFVRDELLASQLALLEPPGDALSLDVAAPPDALVARIRAAIGR